MGLLICLMHKTGIPSANNWSVNRPKVPVTTVTSFPVLCISVAKYRTCVCAPPNSSPLVITKQIFISKIRLEFSISSVTDCYVFHSSYSILNRIAVVENRVTTNNIFFSRLIKKLGTARRLLFSLMNSRLWKISSC